MESRRPNQSILKEITPGYSLEGLRLKLKLWPLEAKSQLIGGKKFLMLERLRAGGEGGNRG